MTKNDGGFSGSSMPSGTMKNHDDDVSVGVDRVAAGALVDVTDMKADDEFGDDNRDPASGKQWELNFDEFLVGEMYDC